jgi:hypothetical protein
MTSYRITLLAGWYQVVETRTDGTSTPIGCFRTEADARDWLAVYLRTQNGAAIFKVGYSVVPASAPTETDAPMQTSADTEASVSSQESN